jgi:AhpD family alkylhydroperoxidase
VPTEVATDQPIDEPSDGGPRVAPGGRREVGLGAWLVSHGAGVVSGTGPPHLFLTLGRRPALFRGWLRFAGRLMPRGSLARRETELVILRVAHLRRCAYEFDHHVHLGRRAGLTSGDLAAVVGGTAGANARERAILAAVDELVARHDLTDGTWSVLRAHLREPEVVELCLLVGHYEMLATTIAALRIQPDAPRRRWYVPARVAGRA